MMVITEAKNYELDLEKTLERFHFVKKSSTSASSHHQRCPSYSAPKIRAELIVDFALTI